jgi:hypothetical protein
MFFRCLLVLGHFLVQRIHLSDFYVKHKFSCFRRKFGDESTLRAVDFRLEERIMTRMGRFEKAAVRTAFSKSGSIHLLHGHSYFIRNVS